MAQYKDSPLSFIFVCICKNNMSIIIFVYVCIYR